MSATSLANINVAAFTHYAAGPIAAQYLGALGARVVKVESPNGDLNRHAIRDPDDALNGVSPYFVCTNRNQRCIVLDLKSDGGIEAGRRLVASSDVVIENYRPGVMDKLGLGFDDARELRSDIIYCSFSAYDATGSARLQPGQDLLMQASSGLASLSGYADGPPIPVGAYVIDGFTAMQGVIGITAALNHRNSTGEGQLIRVDMMSTALYMMTQEASFVLNAKAMTSRSNAGIAHVNHGAPYGIYSAKDGAIAVCVFGGPSKIQRLTRALGVEEELNPLVSDRGLKEQRDRIANVLAREIRTMTVEEATSLLTDGGAWVSPIRTLGEALADDVVGETGIIREYDTSFAGHHRVVTEPLQMSATPLLRDSPAPNWGEHSKEVLLSLGFSEVETAGLFQSGAAFKAKGK